MARLNKVYSMDVTFGVRTHSNMELEGFLDMLRYDRCKVVLWHRIEGGAYTVTVARNDLDFTTERWESFGFNLTNRKLDYTS